MLVADIVVYGGEPGACAAALSAVRRAPAGTEVILCFPEAVPGGVMSVGGLCAWERRAWTHRGRRADPQGGNYAVWLDEIGPVFRPEALASALSSELADAGVRVLAGHEIEAVVPATTGVAPRGRRARRGPPTGISAVSLRAVGGTPDGTPALGAGDGEEISGRVFIDASVTGRLARLSGVPLSAGRADWNPDARQMAATLLVAIRDVDWEAVSGARDDAGKPVWGTSCEIGKDGRHRVFWGGRQVAATDPLLAEFARSHPGVRVGPPRAWEESEGTFWVQSLLLYDVDSTRRAYDPVPEPGPAGPVAAALDMDQATQRARTLAGGPDVLGCLRRFPGLARVQLARDAHDRPRLGGVLVPRESAHAMAPGPEAFAVRVEDVTGAGAPPQEGVDWRHRPRRIGLGFYWMEDFGYTPDEALHATAAASSPTYLPLDAILCPPVSNLLLAGYVARIESRAWWALRTLPNLCVLGDAAGVAAACSLREDVPVLRFGNAEVAAVQAWLAAEGAILDKW